MTMVSRGSEEENLIMYDNEVGAQYLYGGVVPMPANVATRDRTAVPRITTLLTAHGHSPDKAAEIVRLVQRSWAKNRVFVD
jgi:hypothetical protein